MDAIRKSARVGGVWRKRFLNVASLAAVASLEWDKRGMDRGSRFCFVALTLSTLLPFSIHHSRLSVLWC
jgi:hypothetical protein